MKNFRKLTVMLLVLAGAMMFGFDIVRVLLGWIAKVSWDTTTNKVVIAFIVIFLIVGFASLYNQVRVTRRRRRKSNPSAVMLITGSLLAFAWTLMLIFANKAGSASAGMVAIKASNPGTFQKLTLIGVGIVVFVLGMIFARIFYPTERKVPMQIYVKLNEKGNVTDVTAVPIGDEEGKEEGVEYYIIPPSETTEDNGVTEEGNEGT